ncbi:hypothetical protein [Acinetobacter sp. ANC 3791]|uniref:hypothetical protein n=1 Tax=Acinetobacter sp. ANC 3791 TaxID=2529836 RepID=UPI0013F16AAD|nr:hypothetical protein [Acinetobacter sp. ANC 3791]
MMKETIGLNNEIIWAQSNDLQHTIEPLKFQVLKQRNLSSYRNIKQQSFAII